MTGTVMQTWAGDGTLAITRKQYDKRVKSAIAFTNKDKDKKTLVDKLMACVSKLSDDIVFLNKEFTSAVKVYHRKPLLSPHPTFARARLNYPLK